MPGSVTTVMLCSILSSCIVCCQSPFGSCRGGSSGKQQLDLMLSGDEASDYINFVVKDTSSGTWYDQGGTNYHIPLTGSVAMMSIDEQIPDAELPDLPGELCGIWSYIKWEQAGCPNRNEQESQAAYRDAIEVSSCLVVAQHALLSSALSSCKWHLNHLVSFVSSHSETCCLWHAPCANSNPMYWHTHSDIGQAQKCT